MNKFAFYLNMHNLHYLCITFALFIATFFFFQHLFHHIHEEFIGKIPSHNVFFEVRFYRERSVLDWPESFLIVALQNGCTSLTPLICWGQRGSLLHVSYTSHFMTSLPACDITGESFFMPHVYEIAGGIMFSGCPSVRDLLSWSRYLKNQIDGLPPNLGLICYLAEPMNWLDFGVMRSKIMGLIMYAKIACWTHCQYWRMGQTQDMYVSLQSQWTD